MAATVPLFITHEMRRRLREQGQSDASIDKMTPTEAWQCLGGIPQATDVVMRDAARHYVELGFSPIPLRAGEKRPMRAWEEFQRRVVTDAELDSWDWFNVGIVTGAISGIIVLDVDSEEGNAELERLGVPPTPVAQTGKGRHFYFRHPGGDIRNFTRRLPGMDLRADGGYVVAPPSIHPSGIAYEWIVTPDEAELADPPSWLMDLINESNVLLDHVDQTGRLPRRESCSYGTAALASEISALLRSQPGQRNDQLNRAAFSLGQLVASGDLNQADVERELYSASVTIGLRDDPNCGNNGIMQTIRSGLMRGMQQPRNVRVLPQKKRKAVQGFLLTASADDEGNAECVYQVYGHMFLNSTALGWLRWTGTYWSTDESEPLLERQITEVLKARRVEAVKYDRDKIVLAAKPSARHVRDCKSQFASMVSASVNEFDVSPYLLNCQNGVVDLRTGTVINHDASQRFTYCVPVEYDPDADWTEWLDFLGEVVGGGLEVLDYLQQAVGYSISGYTNEECLFYIHGPARSGKGTFTETLLEMLPKPIAIETDFSTFTQKREDANNFDLAPLKPARLVIASESSKYQSLNVGKVKLLTGGNEVYCSFKHRTHFSYRPQYKVWLVSNHPVNADVDDDAAWYRLRAIEFPNSFAGREDKMLKARMKSKQNLKGVLAWAVAGAVKWFSSPTGLSVPTEVENVTHKYRADLDYVQAWLDECCELHPTHWTANDALYLSYREWCRENGVEPKQARSLALSLRAKGFAVGVQKSQMGKNARGVVGLMLKVFTVP